MLNKKIDSDSCLGDKGEPVWNTQAKDFGGWVTINLLLFLVADYIYGCSQSKTSNKLSVLFWYWWCCQDICSCKHWYIYKGWADGCHSN